MGAIAAVPGIDKLGPGIRSKELENFYSTYVEVLTVAWLASFGFLREVRPVLAGNTSECDFRLDFEGKAIYGEVWEPRVLTDEWLVKGQDFSLAIADQRIEGPRRLHTLRR